MKKKVLLTLATVIALGLWVGTAPDSQVYAISGCCKQRASQSDPWYRTGSDFKACKDINSAEGDNIFDPAGKLWWDLAC